MSTYSNLKFELITTGDQTGSWGNTTNTNIGTAIEESIIGTSTVTFASSDVTLTLTNTNATQPARNLRLSLTGTSGGTRNLILGSGCQINKPYLINNGLSDAVTVKNTTGTGISVPAGQTMMVYNNGTNVIDAVTYFSSITLGSALQPISGGTGLTSPGMSGNVLTSNGSAWVSSAPTYPTTSGTSILYGNGSGGFSNVTVGSNLSFFAGTLSATGSGSVSSVSGTGSTSGLTLTGTVTTTGSLTLTGTVNSITTTSGFNVSESGGKLVIKYGATTLMSIDSSGNLTTIANVTAYGTP